MSTPNSIEDLTMQIEQTVQAYVAQAYQAAEVALARAFGASSPGSRKAATPRKSSRPRATAGHRRTDAELAQLCARLDELVRAQPGESMAAFSKALGVVVRELHRPMSKLKRQGRVRPVGERQATRYFPALPVAAS